MGLSRLAGVARMSKGACVLGLDPRADVVRADSPPDVDAEIFSDPTSLADARPDLVVIATETQGLEAVLRAVGPVARDAVVVSMAAGVILATLRQGLSVHGRLVRAMPNLPASVGTGTAIAFAGSGAIAVEERRLVDRLFGAVGAATAVSGSGPGHASVEHPAAARGLGFDAEMAAFLARQTVTGAQAGLEVLDAPTGPPAPLSEAVRAAHARALQPGVTATSPRP